MGNETLQKQVAEQGKEIAKLRKQVDTMRYVLSEMRKVVLEKVLEKVDNDAIEFDNVAEEDYLW